MVALLYSIPLGLLLLVFGGTAGRSLWRMHSHMGWAWRSERDYVVYTRLTGGVMLALGLITLGWMALTP